jgi:hypothetical protein
MAERFMACAPELVSQPMQSGSERRSPSAGRGSWGSEVEIEGGGASVVVLSCGKADGGRPPVDPAESWGAVDLPCDWRWSRAWRARRRMWERRWSGRKARGGRARSFIDVESGTGPVHAPCPKRAVASIRILVNIKVKFISSHYSISYNALFYGYYLGVLC